MKQANFISKIIQRFRAETDIKQDYIRHSSVFASLTDSEVHTLSRVFCIRYFEPEEEIFTEDNPPAAAYLLVEGSVDLYRRHAEHVQDRIKHITPGHFFGVSALLNDNSRRTSAKALEHGTTLALLRSDFIKLMQTHPQITTKILIVIANDLSRDLSTILVEFHTLAQKLAKANILV